jgi:hypothetical protein
MSEPNNSQEPISLGEDTVTINSPEEYMDYVIRATKAMIGVLQFEMQTMQGNISPKEQLAFNVTAETLMEMQLRAKSILEDKEQAIIVPQQGLVDQSGKPL